MTYLASTHADVTIVGAGPAGLALAVALADAGLSTTLIERQPLAKLAEPAPDGRDIALTHHALAILQRLGLWQHFAAEDVAPIRAARVQDGVSPSFLQFEPQGSGKDALGYLVPNHVIRRAAFEAAMARPGVRLVCDARIRDLQVDARSARVELEDGSRFDSALLVAADSRLSETRRRLGIGASLHDFGRTVIVCRMRHERDHEAVAHECFHYGQTLAILPLNDHQVSVVLTARSERAAQLMALGEDDFAAEVMQRFSHRLGTMRLEGARHPYPLVAVYAHRFAAERVALIGDAAVGMHPVTAHGYNFGLYGIENLVGELARARRAGRDIGALATLKPFERRHRLATLPIFLGTQALVQLFTDDSAPAKGLRRAVLQLADRLPGVKAAVSRQLTGMPGQMPWQMSWQMPWARSAPTSRTASRRTA